MKITYTLEPDDLNIVLWRYIEAETGLAEGALEAYDVTITLIDNEVIKLSEIVKNITIQREA